MNPNIMFLWMIQRMSILGSDEVLGVGASGNRPRKAAVKLLGMSKDNARARATEVSWLHALKRETVERSQKHRVTRAEFGADGILGTNWKLSRGMSRS